MNKNHHRRLVKMMYEIDDCSALDKYGSKIFRRSIKGSWRLLRNITRNAKADIWGWSRELEAARYPKIKVPTFKEFATFMLHEAAHGWCHFLKEDPSSLNYSTGLDEEQVCWDVSKLICKKLGIRYHKKSAKLSHQFHILNKVHQKRINQLMKKFPAHNKF